VAEGPNRTLKQLRFDLGGSREEASLLATREGRLGRSRAISQERGVGHAFTSNVAFGIMQECRLETAGKAMIFRDAGPARNRPLAPVFEVGLEA